LQFSISFGKIKSGKEDKNIEGHKNIDIQQMTY